MYIHATPSFFVNADDAVFKASKAELYLKNKEDFKTSDVVSKNNEVKISFFENEKQISLNLSKESLELLKTHFNENNFLSLSDGSIGLNASAAKFVLGWYKDIAYERGFLNADLDKNGIISDYEHLGFKNSVKSSFWTSSDDDIMFLNGTNDKAQGYAQGKIGHKNLSLDELLDTTIKSDKNFDGVLTNLEKSSNGGSLNEGYENLVKEALERIYEEKAKDMSFSIIADVEGKVAKNIGERGKSKQAVKQIYDNFLGKINLSSLNKNEQEHINFFENLNTKNPKLKKDSKELEKELLMQKYPEFKALIQSNENIDETQLKNLKAKRQTSKNYQALSKQDLRQEFSQAVFKTDLEI
ncbi:hypothetical protein [Campylobacter sp. MIT 99-7217]|uniref:hypothetical protein n=1 Tax=Campylobacter sp. MIT 99-7217 TaxID=535091 RepID=UPI00163B982F|nr:hypothetical protein [Campylobacter sp. MIT 99-7217]